MYGRTHHVKYDDVIKLKNELLHKYESEHLLNGTNPVLTLAAQNYTGSVEKIAAQYLVYHDSIRHSSQPCAAQLHEDSKLKLIDAADSGYICVRDLEVFLRRSSIHLPADVIC